MVEDFLVKYFNITAAVISAHSDKGKPHIPLLIAGKDTERTSFASQLSNTFSTHFLKRSFSLLDLPLFLPKIGPERKKKIVVNQEDTQYINIRGG